MADRLVIFIDAQNLYRGARHAFVPPGESETTSHVVGQVDPLALRRLICARGGPQGAARDLSEVRVYTGRPDASKAPNTYAAHMKQCAAWTRSGVTVVARALRYPPDYPSSKPQEKGIDVALAIDYVAYAIDELFDVGVIVSTDTDLRPALEYVHRKCSASCRVEVAAWDSSTAARRLSIKGAHVWCHWLKRADYDSVHDPTDYSA